MIWVRPAGRTGVGRTTRFTGVTGAGANAGLIGSGRSATGAGQAAHGAQTGAGPGTNCGTGDGRAASAYAMACAMPTMSNAWAMKSPASVMGERVHGVAAAATVWITAVGSSRNSRGSWASGRRSNAGGSTGGA